MLKFQPRLYQQTIFNTAASRNTLVVLPTGLGKTNIFLMLSAHRLKSFPNSKILMLAPTKPLANQHMLTAQKYLEFDKDKFALLTGEVAPKLRQDIWNRMTFLFSTPQSIENDIISGKISFEDVSLICFDEAHRAVGDYSYVWIAKKYTEQAKFPRILGLTASPGSDIDKISEVAQNLFIEDIEVRTEDEADVKPYIKDIAMNRIDVDFPDEFKKIRVFFERAYNEKFKDVKALLNEEVFARTKKDVLSLQLKLHERARIEQRPELLIAVSRVAEIIKIQHAMELLETQGVDALHKYMKRMFEEARTSRVKAVQNLVRDTDFKSAFVLVEELLDKGIEHPKVGKLLEIVSDAFDKNKNAKIIVFNNYRDSAVLIERRLNVIPGVSAKLFFGQAKRGDTGLSQKKQKEMLAQFSAGEFNVLISTSIGEEGLDIPKVDVVVFYEPVPSAIRSIQRRGRTGRHEEGEVFILVTKGTRDEAYKWISFHKEKRMYSLLKDIKRKLGISRPQDAVEQHSLSNYMNKSGPSGIKILADFREKNSPILKLLHDMGAKIELKKLDVGDYIVSNDVAIEMKTRQDFVDSIVDRRIIQQAKALRNNFDKPVMIIYGSESFSGIRMMNESSIYGMISMISLSFRIPVITTMSPRETANLIFSIARLEQEEAGDEISMHYRKPLTLAEQQEYLISALPGVGPKIAKPLLDKFGTVKNIANASEKDLMEVPLIGKIKAQKIIEILNGLYEKI